MTRNTLLLVIAGCLGLLAFSGISKYLDSRTIADLKDELSIQKVDAAAADVLIGQVRQQAAADSTRADSVEVVNAALRRDIVTARRRSARVIVRVDSVRATIDEDTLTTGLQTLLAAEREVCKACAAERDLERIRADKSESELRRIQPRFTSTRLLLFRVQAQRDSALALAGDAIAAASPNFFAKLFQDIPQKLACAVGGAIVAEVNDGKALTGAAIALGVCLAMEAIFK